MKSQRPICRTLFLTLTIVTLTANARRADLRQEAPSTAVRSHFSRLARRSPTFLDDLRRNPQEGETRILERQTDLLVEQFVARVNLDMTNLGNSARQLQRTTCFCHCNGFARYPEIFVET